MYLEIFFKITDDSSESFFLDELDNFPILGDDEAESDENELARGGRGGHKRKTKCEEEECAKKCEHRHMKGHCQRGRCKCCRH